VVSVSSAPAGDAIRLTGERYIAAMTARRSDRLTRQAFVELAMSLAAPGSLLLDFGAGPGIDARAFAAQGYRVCIYDTDPEMQAACERLCRDEIGRGQVTLWKDDFDTFLQSTVTPMATPPELGVANFAPLNLVDRPDAVFRAFARLTSPRGRVLASVLNPWFAGDVRYRWWWTHLAALRRPGEFAVRGRQFTVYRRTARFLSEAAAPYFRLDRIEPGSPAPSGFGLRPLRSLARMSSRYLFLLFSKDGSHGDGAERLSTAGGIEP